jgi:hypothetical protein
VAVSTKTSGQAQAGGGEVVSLDEPLLDCAAAAALLNVRVSWVRDAARLGHLPCLRVGEGRENAVRALISPGPIGSRPCCGS